MHSVRDALITDPGRGDAVTLYLAGDLATVGPHPTDPLLVRAGGGIRLGADPDEGVAEQASLLYHLASLDPAMGVPDQPFWDLLQHNGVPFRPHWGKYLPSPTAPFGPAYYQQVYPRLGDFLAKRAAYDPQQIFVTDYWRAQLGIAPVR